MEDLSEINWIANQLGLPPSHIRNFKLACEMNFLDKLYELYSIYTPSGKVEKGTAILVDDNRHIIDSCWCSDMEARHCYVLTNDGEFVSAEMIEKM